MIEQVVSASRIVQSFGIGERLLAKLERESFGPLRRLGMITASGKALEQTMAFFIIFLAYSLCFWYGSIVVAEGTEVGHVMTVSLGQSTFKADQTFCFRWLTM
jgi:hypothetical protein